MGRYVRLSREVRFSGGLEPSSGATGNSLAGNPLGSGLEPLLALTVEAAGRLGEIRWYGPRMAGLGGRRVAREKTWFCRGGGAKRMESRFRA